MIILVWLKLCLANFVFYVYTKYNLLNHLCMFFALLCKIDRTTFVPVQIPILGSSNRGMSLGLSQVSTALGSTDVHLKSG